ncbi:MAG TPA: hypothetical protein VF997_00360 [Polyangia bacterium]
MPKTIMFSSASVARAHLRRDLFDAAPGAAAHAGAERDEEEAADVGLGHRRQAPVVGDVDRDAAAAGAGADAAAEAEAAANVGVDAPHALELHAERPEKLAPYEMPGTKSAGAPPAPARMRTNGSCGVSSASAAVQTQRRHEMTKRFIRAPFRPRWCDGRPLREFSELPSLAGCV